MIERNDSPLLEVRELAKHFAARGSVPPPAGGVARPRRRWWPFGAAQSPRGVWAVDGVSFDLLPGQCLALVGESGSGKTTVARCILRAIRPTAGQVRLNLDGRSIDLAGLTHRELRPLRPHMQMVFQDPYASLNPRMTVGDIIAEPLVVNGVPRPQRRPRVEGLVRQVGLRTEDISRYPHAFSGGQRQRVGIARALALHPRLVVADEPVSALDVSVQAQILNLLRDLQQQLGLTYLLIAHDLSVVRHVADRVAVMYAGQLVEVGAAETIFDLSADRAGGAPGRPLHPYTEALLAAAPLPDPRRRTAALLQGELPSDRPEADSGDWACRFGSRCRYAQTLCREQAPQLREITPGRWARCHFAHTWPRGLACDGRRPAGLAGEST